MSYVTYTMCTVYFLFLPHFLSFVIDGQKRSFETPVRQRKTETETECQSVKTDANCQDRSRLLSVCLCSAMQYSGIQCFALLCIILKYLTRHMTSHVYCIFYLCLPPMSPSPLSLMPPLWQCICCYDGNVSGLIKFTCPSFRE